MEDFEVFKHETMQQDIKLNQNKMYALIKLKININAKKIFLANSLIYKNNQVNLWFIIACKFNDNNNGNN